VRGAAFEVRDLKPITRHGEKFLFGVKSRVFQCIYATDNGGNVVLSSNCVVAETGWTFPLFSSFDTEFNYDFHVTLDETAGCVEYNYADAAALHSAGKLWATKGELPGRSVFLREGDSAFHTYSAYARGLDLLLTTY
jgi:Bacterial protein of unknown function (DUF899)